MSAVPSAVAGTLGGPHGRSRRHPRGKPGRGLSPRLSHATRLFAPARSDIDSLVVIRRDLTHAQFLKLRTWLAQAAIADPWIPRLQMQVLVKGKVKTEG